MASTYKSPTLRQVPDLMECSDSEKLHSLSEKELSRKSFYDRHLLQAANYLRERGGKDSPVTFINRVIRIDDALLKQPSQQGRTYDTNLYYRVWAMVREILREYEDAANGVSVHAEEDDYFQEYYTPPAAVEALYRVEVDSLSPSASPTPAPRRTVTPGSRVLAPRRPRFDDNVQRERQFKYGGPNNETEKWYKDSPASLPFPETLLMAHWESLKIEYDLSRSSHETTFETDVPFDQVNLEKYMNLPQYESGSRFKLPKVNQWDQHQISRYGTVERLATIVEEFNNGENGEERGKDHVPRIFLEKFQVDTQCKYTLGVSRPTKLTCPVALNVVTLNEIRHSINTTPTKILTPSYTSTGTMSTKQFSPKFPKSGFHENDDTPGKLILHKTLPRTTLPASSATVRPGPSYRAIKKAINKSLHENKTYEQNKALEETTQGRRTALVVAVPKRSPGRPRKTPQPTRRAPSSESEQDYEIPVTGSTKRKLSEGSQPYGLPTSSLKKKVRSAKKLEITPEKRWVEWADQMEDDSEDPNFAASPTIAVQTRAAAASGGVKMSKTTAAGSKRGRLGQRESRRGM